MKRPIFEKGKEKRKAAVKLIPPNLAYIRGPNTASG